MPHLERITHFLFLLLVSSLALSKGVTSMAVGLLLVISLLKIRIAFPKTYGRTWILLSPIAVFIALAFSLLYSEHLQKGLEVLYRQNTLLVFPLIFYVHRALIQRQLSLYFKVYIYALGFAAGIVLLFFFLPETTTQSIITQLSFLQDYTPQHKRMAFGAYSPFIDRLQFGYLLGIAILLQSWQCFQEKTNWGQLAILGLLLFAFLILGARGAQLALLASFPIWIRFAYHKWMQASIQQKLGKGSSNVLLLASTVLLIVILPYIAYKNIPAISKRYDQLRWELQIFKQGELQSHDYIHFTSIRRIMSWNNTRLLIQDAPILGVGIGDYETKLAAIYAKDQLGFPVNSHQQFLYYWAAAGLAGLLAFLWSFFLFVWIAWNAPKGVDQALALSFGCFFFIVFLFDVPLLYQVGSTGFYCFYLLLLIWMEDKAIA